MSIRTKKISATLIIHICNADDPHILIERLPTGSLVRIEAREVRHLTAVLNKAGGDLAALAAADEEEGDNE